jgi:hypothetical protein
MSGGVDKLILLVSFIADEFLQLARERGIQKWGYRHVINLLETSFARPIILRIGQAPNRSCTRTERHLPKLAISKSRIITRRLA